jgi:hypothetical protein
MKLEVEDVAHCAVALAAEDAGYLTGQIRHPRGGWVTG